MKRNSKMKSSSVISIFLNIVGCMLISGIVKADILTKEWLYLIVAIICFNMAGMF